MLGPGAYATNQTTFWLLDLCTSLPVLPDRCFRQPANESVLLSRFGLDRPIRDLRLAALRPINNLDLLKTGKLQEIRNQDCIGQVFVKAGRRKDVWHQATTPIVLKCSRALPRLRYQFFMERR